MSEAFNLCCRSQPDVALERCDIKFMRGETEQRFALETISIVRSCREMGMIGVTLRFSYPERCERTSLPRTGIGAYSLRYKENNNIETDMRSF